MDLSFLEHDMRHMIRLKNSNIGQDFSSDYFEKGIIKKGVSEQIAKKKTELLQQLKEGLQDDGPESCSSTEIQSLTHAKNSTLGKSARSS